MVETSTSVVVIARVRRWVDGKHGPYGHAEILTPGAPTGTAIYGINVLKIQPELNKEFRCEIAFSRQRWRVVKLVFDDVPEFIERIRGTVGCWIGRGSSRRLAVNSIRQARSANLPVVIPSDVLRKAGIHSIIPGTTAICDAKRVGAEFRVSALHSPRLIDLIAALQAESGPEALPECIAFPVNAWDRSSGNAAFAITAARARLFALVWLKPSTLRMLGIRRLSRAELPCTDSFAGSLERIARWTDVLRKGSEDEIDALEIDRLLVRVEAVRDNTALRIDQVLAPSRVRVPGPEPEVVDWVAGTVRSIEPAARPNIDRLNVWIRFEDPRLGRGESCIRLYPADVSVGGLARGVPVIVRIVSSSSYWNIARIHRSTPHLPGGAHASEMDE